MTSERERIIARWHLIPDGAWTATRTSDVLPVRFEGMPAVLKIAREEEERRGNRLMAWWDGDGAARVLAHDGDALLMERLDDRESLAEMARTGRDDAASRIICQVAARLHAPRSHPGPELLPLRDWFEELYLAASAEGGIFARAAAIAGLLFAESRDVVVLHGDLHHGNVLRSADGWRAIDPKGLVGERGFDFANIFCNPDAATALARGRFARQLEVVAGAAQQERPRLLRWVFAYAALSAAWFLADGANPDTPLRVAEFAEREIGAV